VVAVKMPAAVSDRLDSLVQKLEVVDEVGGEKVVQRGTSRKELIAALILDAPAKRGELDAKLRKYRQARVERTVLPRPTGEWVVLKGHRPGPRPTSDEAEAPANTREGKTRT
jgi:hypothetical protein